MMARAAALMILVALGILMWNTVTMTGYSAIVFSFVGHPLLGLGLILGFAVLRRRLKEEAAMATEESAVDSDPPEFTM